MSKYAAGARQAVRRFGMPTAANAVIALVSTDWI